MESYDKLKAQKDAIVERERRKILCPAPELRDTFPLVLYFGNSKDRDEFIEIIKQAKPHLITRTL